MSDGHTPGPWIVDAPGMVATKAAGADGWEICDIRADVPECDANAGLIAASPCMYALLEKRADQGDEEARNLIRRISNG